MLSGFGDQTKAGQGQVESVPQGLSIEQRVQRWVELMEQGAPAEQIQQAQTELDQAREQQPFVIRKQIPLFQQMVRKQLDARHAFQHFHLSGGRVVEDRRDQRPPGAPADAAKESAKEGAKREAKEPKGKGKVAKEGAGGIKLHDGRLVRLKEKGYQNFLGDRSGSDRRVLDQEVASERVERMISAFERMILARFEGGKKIAPESPDGKACFRAKTAGEWRDFFAAFTDRLVPKKALLADIREFLLRGLVAKGEKGIFIGDINFANGRIEKFVRFSILAEALARLRALVPGDAVAKGSLGSLVGEELMYLALAVSRARDAAASMLPTQGKFVGGRAEVAAAEALGISLDQHLQQKARGLRGRRSGLFGGDLLGEGEPGELPSQFIPWWQWGNLKQAGPRRWVTAAFYGTLLALSLIGIGALTVRLLGGM